MARWQTKDNSRRAVREERRVTTLSEELHRNLFNWRSSFGKFDWQLIVARSLLQSFVS